MRGGREKGGRDIYIGRDRGVEREGGTERREIFSDNVTLFSSGISARNARHQHGHQKGILRSTAFPGTRRHQTGTEHSHNDGKD